MGIRAFWLALALMLAGTPAWAQGSGTQSDGWITDPRAAAEKGPVTLHFRRVVTLDAKPTALPVTITAILIRIIFKLKLADIVINITSGGPGGATDTVTSFIFREYRERSNVGYGTMLAMVYLVLIVIFMTILMKFTAKYARPRG